MSATRDLRDVGLSTLLRFRWGAAVACLAAGLSGMVPSVTEAGQIAFTAAAVSLALSNVFALRVLTGSDPRIRAGALVILDAVVLTAVLVNTGGAANPFAMLYLVLIALAAALLGPRWCWALAILSTLLYALLFSMPAGHHDEGGLMQAHLEGMWIAFTLSAVLVAGFSSRLAALSERQAADLLSAEEKQKRAERLAALGSFAMDTVHELSTPLTTLAVVAGEMEGDLARGRPPKMSDVALLRDEVARCAAILDALSGRSLGAVSSLSAASLGEIVSACLGRLSPERRQRVVASIDSTAKVADGREAVERALANLLSNALDAAPGARVSIRDIADQDGVCVLVEDDGPGMSEDTFSRAGEPFFTTKGRDRGLGLGLFAARTLVAQIGGTIELKPRAQGGIEARLWFPLAS